MRESDFNGEGMGFQMCAQVRILNSSFCGNTGNGLHPGAGSTDALFRNWLGARPADQALKKAMLGR